RVPGDVNGLGGDKACLADPDACGAVLCSWLADRNACGAVLSSWLADRDACGAVLSSWQVHRGLGQGERRRERESKCQCDCRQFHGLLLAFGQAKTWEARLDCSIKFFVSPIRCRQVV